MADEREWTLRGSGGDNAYVPGEDGDARLDCGTDLVVVPKEPSRASRGGTSARGHAAL